MKFGLLAVLVLVLAGYNLAVGSSPDAGEAAGLEPLPGRPFIVPENALEERLVQFAREPNSANEATLFEELKTATVYVKVGDEVIGPDGKPVPGKKVRIWTVTVPDGTRAVALYTSKKRMGAAFSPETKIAYIGYSGGDALRFAIDQPVALNWGVDPHVLIPTATVKRLQSESLH
jgi:hypothetical protein